jgi:hypothetical protein
MFNYDANIFKKIYVYINIRYNARIINEQFQEKTKR